jgi:hypothetical protein
MRGVVNPDTADKIPKNCSQCPGTFFAIATWQGFSHPVCLQCWSLFQDKLSNMQEQNARAMNHLSAEMEWCSGLPIGTMPRYAPPPPKYLTKIGGLVLNNITIKESAIGVINTGTIKGNLQSIDASLTLLNKQPQYREFLKVIRDLSEAIVNANEASEAQKEAIVEWLSTLIEQARSAKESRKPSLIKAAIKELSELAGAVVSVQTLWNAAVPVINQFFL